MEVICKYCGEITLVDIGGRKKLTIPFKLVCEALRVCPTTELAAIKLGCSVGYIYKKLKEKNLLPRDIQKESKGE